ncbi:MAG TPA: hypothetical protein VFQ35_10315 [Polyangiaceae bacterium]|nr:hypothetical protein [Polyangiaceae bacterium]
MTNCFTSSSLRFASRALVFGAWLFSANGVRAAEPDSATAQALFSSARKLANAGKFSEACAKFEESERIESAIGTEFHLAKCWEKLGRTASAWAMFLRVASRAKAQNQSERAELASLRARALEGKLARLKIDVRAKTKGLEIFRDGEALGEASLGEAVPLDPGEYEISARAPGYESFSTRVKLGESAGVSNVLIPELTPSVALPAEPPPPLHTSTPSKTSTSVNVAPSAAKVAPAGAETASSARPLAFVLGGLGIASVGVGVAFALDFKHVCPNREECQGRALSRAKTDRVLAYTGWGLGGAALATSLVLFLRSPARSDTRASWVLTPVCAPSTCGATFTKEF